MIDIPGFKESVAKAWSTAWYGKPARILCQKLKLVKLNKAHGNLQNNVHSARIQLHDLQEKMASNLFDKSAIAEEIIAAKALE